MGLPMASERDYYDILGVARNASADDLRKAHRRLVRKHHPDVNKAPDAAAKFAEIQHAYDVLSDPAKRKAYDEYGHAGPPHPGFGGAAGPQPGGNWNVNIDPDQMQDIFEGLFGARSGRSGGSPFGGFGGAASSRRARRAPSDPGEDLHHTLNVGFMTAAEGGIEHLRLRTGDEFQTVEVKIPKGISSGAKLRLKGRGHQSPSGGPPGDLILTIEVGAHPFFRREGLDLTVEVPVSIAEAALGTTVEVPLLAGSLKLKVPPGTSSGQKLRVRGRGLTDVKGATGDYYAQIQIVAPANPDAETRELLEELGRRLPPVREQWPWGGA